MAHFNNLADFEDPNWPPIPGPLLPPVPPRRAPGSRRKTQLVWPRDKKQKGAHTWSRFWDVLSSKGPDMWVAKQGDLGPTRPEWSRWDLGPKYYNRFGNLGYYDGRNEQIPPWRLAHDDENKRYNFRNRKYEEPHWLGSKTWTDVKWDRHGRKALYKRYPDGWPDIDPVLMNRLLILGLDYPPDPLTGLPGNPFAHDPTANWWNWYSDQLPVAFPKTVLGP
ncbi:MAG: hypothetical protein Q9219_005702 [cf. Caloplaca sp. 3 TL-2023]